MPRRTLELRLGEREGVVVRDGVCLLMGMQRWRGEESCKAWIGWIRVG